MYTYAGWLRGTGAIPCLVASAQVICPFLLSSHRRRGCPFRAFTESGRPDTVRPLRALSRAFFSLRSMLRPYLSLTRMTVLANSWGLSLGIHSPASLPLFWRFTAGSDRVRLSRSLANLRLVAALAAHKPESWASLKATMCSMWVSRRPLVSLARVPASDASHSLRYGWLYGLGVPIVSVPVVGGAAILREDFQAHPGFGMNRTCDQEQQRKKEDSLHEDGTPGGAPHRVDHSIPVP